MEGMEPPEPPGIMEPPEPPGIMEPPEPPGIMEPPEPPGIIEPPEPPGIIEPPEPPGIMEPPEPPGIMEPPEPPGIIEPPEPPGIGEDPPPPDPIEGSCLATTSTESLGARLSRPQVSRGYRGTTEWENLPIAAACTAATRRVIAKNLKLNMVMSMVAFQLGG